MSSFPVSPEKSRLLTRRMEALGIREDELEERFILGGGKGGQKVNKTASCVYLLHRPTGVEVKCRRERSQAMNRFFARRMLCDRIEEQREGVRSARQQEAEKIRRRKRRRSRRARDRMLDEKSKHARKKELRKPLRGTDE